MSDILNRIGEQLVERDRDRRPSWYCDPVAFCSEVVDWPDGQALTAYQAEIMRALVEHLRVAVRGPHGLGKSALAALLVLWFGLSRELAGENWAVLTTASGWRQVSEFLWREIRLWARQLRWSELDRGPFDGRTELLSTMLKLRYGQAFGAASDDPARLEGLHADHVLILLDEAKSIPAPTWEALEGALSGTGSPMALAISTPGTPSGVFFDIHERKPGYEEWWVRHVRLDEAIAARRISPTWAAARARQWGVSSSVYKTRVLGEFSTSDEDAVIPLEWIELANERWQVWKDSEADPGPLTVVGVDVARGGQDKTALALRCGDLVTEIRRFHHADTMATTGRVVALLEANPGARATVDVIGLGMR